PGAALDELEIAAPGIEARPEEQRLGEHEKRHDERNLPHDALLVVRIADQLQEQRAGDRQRDQRRENRKVHQRLIATSSTPERRPLPGTATPRTSAPTPFASAGAARSIRRRCRRRR